jgi:hypothetical protein
MEAADFPHLKEDHLSVAFSLITSYIPSTLDIEYIPMANFSHIKTEVIGTIFSGLERISLRAHIGRGIVIDIECDMYCWAGLWMAAFLDLAVYNQEEEPLEYSYFITFEDTLLDVVE